MSTDDEAVCSCTVCTCACSGCTEDGPPLLASADEVTFVWRGEGLPTSDAITLRNTTCTSVCITARSAKNGARVAVRPKVVVIRPKSAAEILFVQAGVSRGNTEKARFKLLATAINNTAVTNWSMKLSTKVVDPSPKEYREEQMSYHSSETEQQT